MPLGGGGRNELRRVYLISRGYVLSEILDVHRCSAFLKGTFSVSVRISAILGYQKVSHNPEKNIAFPRKIKKRDEIDRSLTDYGNFHDDMNFNAQNPNP